MLYSIVLNISYLNRSAPNSCCYQLLSVLHDINLMRSISLRSGKALTICSRTTVCCAGPKLWENTISLPFDLDPFGVDGIQEVLAENNIKVYRRQNLLGVPFVMRHTSLKVIVIWFLVLA